MSDEMDIDECNFIAHIRKDGGLGHLLVGERHREILLCGRPRIVEKFFLDWLSDDRRSL